MAILINAHQLGKSFGGRSLFEAVTFGIEGGDRIGLIGPNGAGKSTLLRILASQITPDSGTLSCQRGLRVGFLEQTPVFRPGATVLSTALEGVEDPHDWDQAAVAHEALRHLSLEDASGHGPEMPIDKLSGGWKKRVALARELAKKPDLLLLDEPTNHLDVEAILWLEEFLSNSPFATLTVTHDRLFLQRVSNRILELDRRNPGGLFSVQGDYADYLEAKSQRLAAQERQEQALQNTLRRETEWLRRGPKARTTKQQARIRRAGDLKEQVEDLSERNLVRRAQIDFESGERRPRKLIEAKQIAKSYGGKALFSGLDLLIGPGHRVGLLGANGCGKSTLLRVLLGLEAPDRGTVKHADYFSVAYFEQNRETLDLEVSVAKTVCPEGDYVDYRGNKIHIRGYLDRFLFPQNQMEMPVGKLSGGEQSRLLLARLMLKEANLLVLDEPTNDLDLATLHVLEDCLIDFEGAILLVTHDRYFLDRVATKILAFGPDAKVVSFEDLAQWENWHREQAQAESKPKPKKGSSSQAIPGPKRKKLSYKDQREFDSIEQSIHQAEAALARATEEHHRPDVVTNSSRLIELTREISTLTAEIERLYTRWAELERALHL